MKRIPFWLWLVGGVAIVAAVAAVTRVDPAYQFAIDIVSVAIAGIVLAIRRAGRREPQGSPQIDAMMIAALYATTGSGPNDLLIGQDGKAYWVSSLRYPGAGWQTAVFDRSLANWLDRPLFRINEMEDPDTAVVNHLTALEVVGHAPRTTWPSGMHFEPCQDRSWLSALADVGNRLAGDSAGRIQQVDVYVALRNQLRCRHL